MTISINGNQYTYNYSQNRNVKEPNPTLSYGSNSIFDNYNSTTVQNVSTNDISDACTDGVDDGQISFGEKASSFIKGIFSPITSLFKSPENFIKGAAMIAGGAALCAVTGGAAMPFLVAAGVVGGGVQVVKGAINASNATTDAEAKAAWEDMGCGTGVVAGSVIGAKSAAKAAGIEGAENMSALQATKACFKYSGQKIGGLFTGSSSAAAGTAGTKTSSAESNSKPAEVGATNKKPAVAESKPTTTETTVAEKPTTVESKPATTEAAAAKKPVTAETKPKTAQETYDQGCSDAKVAEQAKAERLAHQQDKALTSKNQNSPQADSYKLANETPVDSPEYIEVKPNTVAEPTTKTATEPASAGANTKAKTGTTSAQDSAKSGYIKRLKQNASAQERAKNARSYFEDKTNPTSQARVKQLQTLKQDQLAALDDKTIDMLTHNIAKQGKMQNFGYLKGLTPKEILRLQKSENTRTILNNLLSGAYNSKEEMIEITQYLNRIIGK